MKVVAVNLSPPVGPDCVPTTCSRNQGIAPGTTNWLADGTKAQTALVSRESCQVARGVSDDRRDSATPGPAKSKRRTRGSNPCSSSGEALGAKQADRIR